MSLSSCRSDPESRGNSMGMQLKARLIDFFGKASFFLLGGGGGVKVEKFEDCPYILLTSKVMLVHVYHA